MSRKVHHVKTPASSQKKWTVAVFMVGGAELGPAIQRDLMEFQRVGSSVDVNVVLAVHPDPDVTTDGQWVRVNLLPIGDEDAIATMTRIGQSTAKGSLDLKLDQFLQHVVTRFPADHYLLIMWGHASGLGFGDLRTGSKSAQVALGSLVRVLRNFQKSRGGNSGKLEILGFCACAVNKAEYALELGDTVDYLIASQVGISTLMTWPFDDVIDLLLLSPTVTAESLARQIVQSFDASYEPPPVALTALNLNESMRIGEQVSEVSTAILRSFEVGGKQAQINKLCVLEAFMEALDAYPYDADSVVDFFDLCRRLFAQRFLDNAVRTQARRVLDEGFESFVVQDARSGPKTAALKGLSILAPDFDDPEWLKTCRDCASAKHAYIWSRTKWALVTEKVYEFDQSRRSPAARQTPAAAGPRK